MTDLVTVANGDASAGVRAKINDLIGHRNRWVDAKTNFSAVGNGTADDTSPLQALVDSGERRVFIPAGVFKVSAPIKIPSAVQVIGAGAHGSGGTIIAPDLSVDWATVYPGRGVIETSNFTWTTGGTGPGYWNSGSVQDLQVRCHQDALYATYPERVPDYGIVIWAPGEDALLRRVQVQRAGKAGVLLGGYMAVMQVEDCCTAFTADGPGVMMGNHPDAGFASGVAPALGGRGSGGSVRFFGISGDSNSTALLHADGTQIVEAAGLKSESNPAAVLIGGSSTGSARQRWNITGYRYDIDGGAANRDLVKIVDTARPQVWLGPGASYNAVNLINDVVRSVTVTDENEGYVMLYDPDQSMSLYAGKIGFFGTAPIAKPTGVAVSAAGIHAALVSLGLISA